VSFTLGVEPESFTVILSPGADFVSTITASDGDPWGSAVVSLVFDDDDETTWSATVASDELRWNVDKVAVDALIAASPSHVRLTFVDGTTDLLWAKGRVSVR
jgi:hypothetical protein